MIYLSFIRYTHDFFPPENTRFICHAENTHDLFLMQKIHMIYMPLKLYIQPFVTHNIHMIYTSRKRYARISHTKNKTFMSHT